MFNGKDANELSTKELNDMALMISNIFNSLHDWAKPEYKCKYDAIMKELARR
jgi:hypothetical protein